MLINIITVIIAVIVISFILWWFFGNHESAAGTAEIVDGQQLATISVDGGYSPETLIFKQGMPAKLTFNRKDPSTCLEHVVFPDFGIDEALPVNQNVVIDFDTRKAGEYAYHCGMNMFHAKVIIK
ncbi:cupredoxin domain-containing protein [Lactococcus piscium]|uniref:Cupredoxin domain protein n=1 Tax=Pseudolactococcus piscium MKFS47 TaxID=297352 RepID=A0A0D6E0E5_9LACT|nr:cupredoxin domain-containing protein [Lactococcus piscium]CEN29562.1 Cupredoxin domain protein [Lactococcus piscium MKFS47]